MESTRHGTSVQCLRTPSHVDSAPDGGLQRPVFGTSGAYWYAAANNADATRKAHSNWNNRAQQSPYTSAPRGSLVFYNTSTAGHVAISLGNGKVYSTSAGGRIGIVAISYFQNPYGWAYAPW